MNKIKEFPNTDIKEEQAAEKPNFGIIGGVVAVLLLAVGGFWYLDFSQHRILFLRAYDLSESGLEHIEVQKDHCQLSQRNQKVGDYSVTMGFADKAQVVTARLVNNQLDFVPCDFDASAFGQLPGTSVLKLFQLAQTEVRGYRTRGINYPVVFTIILDAAEPVPGEDPFNEQSLQELKKITDELTENGYIRIIGPETTLQQWLKESLAEKNPKIKIGSYNDAKNDTEESIKQARKG
ncbi:MAG: hypothetical protein AB4057_19705 [Crocosphaera sp.]